MAGSSSNRFLNEAIELAHLKLRKGEFFELICALEQSTKGEDGENQEINRGYTREL